MDIHINKNNIGYYSTYLTVEKAIQQYLQQNGYLKIDLPVLSPTLVPESYLEVFETEFKYLNNREKLYLTPSPELFLKRLLVSGIGNCYYLGKAFRNSDPNATLHSFEFTMLEFYWAYSDYKEGMKFTEKMLRHIAKKVLGKQSFEFEGKKIDFSKSFERVEFNELLQKHTNINYEDYNFQSLLKKAQELSIKIDKKVFSKGEVADLIYKKMIQPKLVQPTFVIHHPIEMKPLAKPLVDHGVCANMTPR